MDLRYLLLVFRSRWLLLVAATVGCALLGIAAALILRTETATATLLIRGPLASAEPGQRSGGAAVSATVLEALASHRVARQVVTRSGMSLQHPHVVAWGEPEAGVDPIDWMASRLLQSTKFSSADDSNVISVRVTSRQRGTASQLANAFVDAYLDLSRDVQVEQAKQRKHQLELGLPRVEEEVSNARAHMTAFRTAHPDFNPDPRSDYAATLLASLSHQLAQLESEGAANRGGPELSGELGAQGASVQVLQADLRRAQLQMEEVAENYGVNHPRHRTAAAGVALAEDALRRGRERASRVIGSRAATLKEEIRREKARALGQASLHEEYAALQRRLATAEAALAAAGNALRQASLESEAAVATASVLAYAAPQPERFAERLRSGLSLGGVLGLLLGSIVAVLAEEASPRFRLVRSAAAAFATRVLARVPAAHGKRRPRLRAKRIANPPGTSRGKPDLPVRRSAPMGQILVQSGTLTEEQARHIADRQQTLELPFGEAGLKLGLLQRADVERALNTQWTQQRRGCAPVPADEFLTDFVPDHPAAEAIRALRSRLLLEWRQGAPRRALSLQSLAPGEGKSFLACNLAMAFAQAKQRTVLVDLNLREPHLHDVFGVHAHSGLSTILADPKFDDSPDLADHGGYLTLIPAGPPAPDQQDLICGAEFADLIGRLEHRFDVVILDAPAWSAGADAQLIAAVSDVLLVVRANHTRLNPLQDVRAELERMQVRILGMVVNEH